MPIRFAARGPVVVESDLTAFETRLEYPLPPDYRQFLLQQNGGEVLAADGKPITGARLFSLLLLGFEITEADLEVSYDADPMEWPEFCCDLDVRSLLCIRADYPVNLLPIGDVADGSLFLWLDGPDVGAVDLTFDPDGYVAWHCHRVAASFGELLQNFPMPDTEDESES